MSRIQKSLAVFLSVVLFLGAFSVATPVFAQEVTDAVEHYEFVQDAINNPAIAEDTAPEAEIVFEVEEKEAYKVNSIANYLHNQGITQGILESADVPQEELFIYNQNTRDINKYRCGVVTSGPKGCGWIATYNASKLLGYNLKPEEIIKEYEEMGIFMQGFFGVHPFAVAKFFVDRGHDIDVYFGDFVDLDTLNNLSEVNIIFYDGNPTGHYATIQYDEKDKNNPNDDVFIGYNVFGSNGIETLTNGIAIPETKDDTSRKFTGKVLISILPKEQSSIA